MNAHTQQLVIWLFMSIILTAPCYFSFRRDANRAFTIYLQCKEQADNGGTPDMPSGCAMSAGEWAERANDWQRRAITSEACAKKSLFIIPAFCAVFIILFGW